MQSKIWIDQSLYIMRDLIFKLPVDPPQKNAWLDQMDQAALYLNKRDFLSLHNCFANLGQKLFAQLPGDVSLKHYFVPLINEIQELQKILSGLSLPPDSPAQVEIDKPQTNIESVEPPPPDSTITVSLAVDHAKEEENPAQELFLRWTFPSSGGIRK